MIHHVYANRSNAGDWLSALGIQSLLGRTVVEHFCDEPFVDETLAHLASADVGDFVVIGGGGLLMDYFMPFWNGFAPLAERLAFAVWGVGCCDLKLQSSMPDPSLFKRVIANSTLWSVRDEMTLAWLDHPALAGPIACPSLSIVDRRPLGCGVLHVDSYENVGAAVFDATCAACEQFAADTRRPYHKVNNLIQFGDAERLDDLIGQYAAADIVVSSRLHGCLIGLAMGRRVIAISGDRKIESFMAAAGLKEWVLDLPEIDRLNRSLAALDEQPDSGAFIERARARNRAIAATILGHLESP